MTNYEPQTGFKDGFRRLPVQTRSSRIWILFITISLFLLSGCGRYRTAAELKLNGYYAEIIKRVDQRSIGQDGFFEKNLLSNPEPQVQHWCALALGRIASPDGLPLLYKAAKSGDSAVRAASAFSIGLIESRRMASGQAPDSRSIRELEQVLDDRSIGVRIRAVEALGRIGSPDKAEKIIGLLETFLNDDSAAGHACVHYAITALARMKNPVALPLLERLASAKSPETQWRALDALARIGDSKAGPLYIGATKSPDPQVQYYAARGLATLDARSTGKAATGEFLKETAMPGKEALGASPVAPDVPVITDAVGTALAVNRKNGTIAIITTTRGIIEIELFREEAPLVVENFVRISKRGLLNQFTFTEVTPSQWIGGNCIRSAARFGRTVAGEINMRPLERGSVAMSVEDGRPGDVRFSIALAPQPYWDGDETCFGRVISGIQAAERIVPGDRILHVAIKEKISFHDYVKY